MCPEPSSEQVVRIYPDSEHGRRLGASVTNPVRLRSRPGAPTDHPARSGAADPRVARAISALTAARSCASCCCARASLSRQDHRPDHPRAFGRGGSCTSPRRCAKPCGHRPARPCVPAGHRPWSPTAWPSCSYAVPQNARHLRTDLQAAALQSEFVNEPVGTDTSRTTVARGPSTRCRNP